MLQQCKGSFLHLSEVLAGPLLFNLGGVCFPASNEDSFPVTVWQGIHPWQTDAGTIRPIPESMRQRGGCDE